MKSLDMSQQPQAITIGKVFFKMRMRKNLDEALKWYY